MPSSHLLRLPTEILRLILEPFLPRTALLRRATTRLKRKPFHDIIWVNRQNKTAISLLLACQRLHDLCSELIYGARNQFVLRTSYEGSVWVFRRLLEFKGLVPTETRRVEDCFGAGGGSLEDLSRLRNRAVWERVRRWCVEVTVEDGYTGKAPVFLVSVFLRTRCFPDSCQCHQFSDTCLPQLSQVSRVHTSFAFQRRDHHANAEERVRYDKVRVRRHGLGFWGERAGLEACELDQAV